MDHTIPAGMSGWNLHGGSWSLVSLPINASSEKSWRIVSWEDAQLSAVWGLSQQLCDLAERKELCIHGKRPAQLCPKRAKRTVSRTIQTGYKPNHCSGFQGLFASVLRDTNRNQKEKFEWCLHMFPGENNIKICSRLPPLFPRTRRVQSSPCLMMKEEHRF